MGLQGAIEADRGPMDLISVQLENAGFLSSPLFKHMSLFQSVIVGLIVSSLLMVIDAQSA